MKAIATAERRIDDSSQQWKELVYWHRRCAALPNFACNCVCTECIFLEIKFGCGRVENSNDAYKCFPMAFNNACKDLVVVDIVQLKSFVVLLVLRGDVGFACVN
ncbi:hypothetical protein T4D_15865 [Trichinella pseudospiralis]|uniref:Uncharacterized protein n=1 Tax=Trichinella pseudospiralis TaxID=6337 RepID=A0A0V1FQH1_TRIPS|nr:hypothetical protein T4D_15865 [Trichinella pseudospiralis]